jgi:hypothetical protein
VLVCSERKVLLAGGWFVVREKYCCLMADKPSEQGAHLYPLGPPKFPFPYLIASEKKGRVGAVSSSERRESAYRRERVEPLLALRLTRPPDDA